MNYHELPSTLTSIDHRQHIDHHVNHKGQHSTTMATITSSSNKSILHPTSSCALRRASWPMVISRPSTHQHRVIYSSSSQNTNNHHLMINGGGAFICRHSRNQTRLKKPMMATASSTSSRDHLIRYLNNKCDQCQQSIINTDGYNQLSIPALWSSAFSIIDNIGASSSATSFSSGYESNKSSPTFHCKPPLLFDGTDHENSQSSTSIPNTANSNINNVNPLKESSSPPPPTYQSSSSTLTPPCVVISDHSQDDQPATIVHSFIPFDSTDCSNNNDLDFDGNLSNNSTIFRRDSVSSICSSTSSLSSLCDDETLLELISSTNHVDETGNTDAVTLNNLNASCRNMASLICSIETGKRSKWGKVRSLVTSPFIQTYKRQKYPWIQLAGHQGNFLAGQLQGTILKKLCGNEVGCFEKLMADEQLAPLVPRFKNVIVFNEQTYLELEDLLATFVNPSVMDIKMGIRTYLEEELVKAREKPKLRKDMYEKMVAIDPDEPKPEENEQKAITKPRYMVWRETISSTSTLGFRIDGIKLSTNRLNTTSTQSMIKDLKRTKSEEAVRLAILEFTGHNFKYLNIFLNKLKLIRKRLEESDFFQTHEMIGSSLLFVHDHNKADVWMIDFAKTYPLPPDVHITHRDKWQPGNHEDGYLIGMDNLIRIFCSFIDKSYGDS